MTVYVDDMCNDMLGEYGRMKMSHMIADTTEELRGMAETIGVQLRWIQNPGTHKEHFDIAKVKRTLAIKSGAVPITMKQCSSMVARRRELGFLGSPADAIEWRQNYKRKEPA